MTISHCNLQCKNEMFKGLFLDCFEDSIEDGSIFKFVLEKKEVCWRQEINMGTLYQNSVQLLGC